MTRRSRFSQEIRERAVQQSLPFDGASISVVFVESARGGRPLVQIVDSLAGLFVDAVELHREAWLVVLAALNAHDMPADFREFKLI